MHLDLIDELKPFYGNSRPEVIRNIVIDWIKNNIGSAHIGALRERGAMSTEKK